MAVANIPPLSEEALRGASAYLLASVSESFGLSALEAMACSVPVVAPRVGGLPEVVRHGIDGYLEPVGDVEAMAADAGKLLRDEDLRLTLGDAARERALGTFAEGPIVDQYEALYRRVLGQV